MTYWKTKIASVSMGEKNDCTVIALSLATGISYQQAHRLMKLRGRQDGHGISASHRKACLPLNDAIECCGYKLIPAKSKYKTLVSLTKAIKTNKTLVVYSGGKKGPNHVTVYKDGLCEDWAGSKKKPITSIWLVEPAI